MMILILTAIGSTSALSISHDDSMTIDILPKMTVSEKQFFNNLLPEQQANLLQRHWSEKERLKGKEHLAFKRAFQYPEIIAQKKKHEQIALKGLSYVTVGSFGICNYQTIQQAVNTESSGQTIRVTNETFSGDAATFNVSDKSFIFRGGYTHCGTTAVVSGKTTLDGTGMSFDDSIIELTDTVGGMNIDMYDFFIFAGKPDLDFGGGIEITGKGIATSAQRMDVTLNSVDVFGNLSTTGAGIHMTNGDLILTNNSNIATNRASEDGGGIYCRDGTILVNGDAVIGDNGVLFHTGNVADSDNTNSGNGGGVYLNRCDFVLDASDGVNGAYIISNSAREGGGVFGTNSSLLELKGDQAWINLNQASGGGGISLELNTTANLYNAKIKGNTASVAGGITLNDSTLNFTQSTVYPCQGKCGELSENETTGVSAAISLSNGAITTLDGIWIENNKSSGGVILSYLQGSNSILTINNSMILHNDYIPSGGTDVSGLFDIRGGSFNSQNNTIAGNTLDVVTTGLRAIVAARYATITMDSNIVWDNDNLYSTLIDSSLGPVTSSRTNNITNFFIEQSSNPKFLVPGLDYHLQPNSPAIDYGSESLSITRDIDGETRGLQNTPDAGADEANIRVGVAGNICEYGTITEAIAAANDGDTIYISKGNYVESPGTINISLTLVQSNNTCEAEQVNAQASDLVIDGSNNFTALGGLFSISNNKIVSFENMTLQNAKASYGGIIYAGIGTNLLLNNVVIQGGSASQYGGGIRAHGDLQIINGSKIINNNATSTIASDNQSGAGVAVSSTGSLSVEDNSVIVSNDAVGEGGGVYSDGHITLVDSAMIFANSGNNGGGVYVSSNGSLALYNSSRIGEGGFGNSATNGGGVFCVNTSLNLNNTTQIISNTATNGGGVYADSCIISLTGTSRIGNIAEANNATSKGGGAYLTNASSLTMGANAKVSNNTALFGAGVFLLTDVSGNTLSGGTIENNSAVAQGGGVYIRSIQDSAIITVENMTLRGNRGQDGGGIAYESVDNASLLLPSLLVTTNSATQNGGGLYVFGTAPLVQLSATSSSFIVNSSQLDGGGIAIKSPVMLEISNTTIGLNVSSRNGGGIYLGSGVSLDASVSVIESNLANSGDGGGLFVDSLTQNSTVLLRNQSRVSSNQSIDGAGIFMQADQGISAALNIFDTQINNNTASGTGGALSTIYTINSIRSTKMFDNTANVDGAAFKLQNSNSTIWNTLSYDNVALGDSYVIDEGLVDISESTFVDFSTPVAFVINGTVQFTLTNSILSGYNDAFVGVATAGLTTQCNLDSTGELGNTALPLFVDAANNDYHLQASSNAINQCSTGSADDYAHDPRPVGGGATPYDIGAFEYQGTIALPDSMFMNGFE